MTRHWVNDHEWHDIEYSELPGWVRRRIKTLHRKQLVGRHFRYRLASGQLGAPRYEIRLRHHIPIHQGATFQLKQSKSKRSPLLFLLLSLVLLAAIVLTVVLFGSSHEGEVVPAPLSTSTPVVTATLIPSPTRTPAPTPTSSLPISNSSKVWVDNNTYLVGGDGQPIILVNNPNAQNPSWSQLVSFLSTDSTDKMCYKENSFVCADFAEMLHNNAEKAGWRAAYVSIGLTGSGGGHTLNAFQTTDLGLVYIDCTGFDCGESRPINMDSRIELRVGSQYIPQCIFPESGWYCTSPSMGIVTAIEVVQW